MSQIKSPTKRLNNSRKTNDIPEKRLNMVNRNDEAGDDNEDDDDDDEENVEPAVEMVKSRAGLRGNALAAALLADSDDDDDDSDEPNQQQQQQQQQQQPRSFVKHRSGIYSQKLRETKKDLRAAQTKTVQVEAKMLNANNRMKHNEHTDDDDDDESNCVDDDERSDQESGYFKSSCAKGKKTKNSDSSAPPSPPPPPSNMPPGRKRRSSNLVSKQLKELELFKNQQHQMPHSIASANGKGAANVLVDTVQGECVVDDDDDTLDKIMVKVSTKQGLHKWEISENDKFQVIFENVARVENTQADQIVLMLKERIIGMSDTPASVQLKVYDIIDCVRNSGAAKTERVQLIDASNESDEDEHDEAHLRATNRIVVSLQTEEGRKSRLRFAVVRDEPLGNVLAKYVDVRKMPAAYCLIFDGDVVGTDETADDLDLDGDEIFDVKVSKNGAAGVKAKTPLLNPQNYNFDDDVLTC